MLKLPRWFGLVSILALGLICGCNKPAEKAAAPVTSAETTGDPSKKVLESAAEATADAPLAVPSGPAPVATKVDLAVQKRIAVLGETFKQDAAKKDPEGIVVLNDFKQIGLAFHMYHSSFGHFPAMNGDGIKGAPHPGLSWRVYLLPYLDQTPLFEKFKKDEPWDSEHNKTLIAEMPKVFGQNSEGKTRIHVLTGAGAPFKNDESVRLEHIVDGTYATLLCVKAGDETADIWTKPGGLEFDPENPLKCLGTTADKFLTLMMDGSVRYIPKSIAPDKFASLVQVADGKVIDLVEIEKESRAPVAEVKLTGPATPLLPASPRLDLSYVPADAFAAVVLHPRRIYEHEIVRSIREQLPPDLFGKDSRLLPYRMVMGITEVIEISRSMGISPQSLDEVVVLFDKSVPDKLMQSNGRFAVPQLGVILRNSAPFDTEAMARVIASQTMATGTQDYEGVTLVLVREDLAFAFVTDSMFLMGQVDFVKKMISARDSTQPTSGLTRRLEAAGNRLVVVVVDAFAVKETVSKLLQQVPFPISLVASQFVGVRDFSLTLDLDASEMVLAQMQFKTSQLAEGVFGLADQQFKKLQDDAKQQLPRMRDIPDAANFLPYVEQLVSETTLTNRGDTISLTIPKLKDLDKLPKLLGPAIERVRDAANRSVRLNKLRQVGIAFHQYQEVYQRFPALNGAGEKSVPHPGLSWRVALLPFLEQDALYRKFKLDEPWDSEHNKALIAKMPDIFGTRQDGKTSLHVFTGKGAPFQDGEGITFQAVTDGMSKTLLAVEAGDDVAEIWTKPGGLVFDPEDPLKCLGAVQKFSALMMDGAVNQIDHVNSVEFSKLVQHQDGQPLKLP